MILKPEGSAHSFKVLKKNRKDMLVSILEIIKKLIQDSEVKSGGGSLALVKLQGITKKQAIFTVASLFPNLKSVEGAVLNPSVPAKLNVSADLSQIFNDFIQKSDQDIQELTLSQDAIQLFEESNYFRAFLQINFSLFRYSANQLPTLKQRQDKLVIFTEDLSQVQKLRVLLEGVSVIVVDFKDKYIYSQLIQGRGCFPLNDRQDHDKWFVTQKDITNSRHFHNQLGLNLLGEELNIKEPVELAYFFRNIYPNCIENSKLATWQSEKTLFYFVPGKNQFGSGQLSHSRITRKKQQTEQIVKRTQNIRVVDDEMVQVLARYVVYLNTELQIQKQSDRIAKDKIAKVRFYQNYRQPKVQFVVEISYERHSFFEAFFENEKKDLNLIAFRIDSDRLNQKNLTPAFWKFLEEQYYCKYLPKKQLCYVFAKFEKPLSEKLYSQALPNPGNNTSQGRYSNSNNKYFQSFPIDVDFGKEYWQVQLKAVLSKLASRLRFSFDLTPEKQLININCLGKAHFDFIFGEIEKLEKQFARREITANQSDLSLSIGFLDSILDSYSSVRYFIKQKVKPTKKTTRKQVFKIPFGSESLSVNVGVAPKQNSSTNPRLKLDWKKAWKTYEQHRRKKPSVGNKPAENKKQGLSKKSPFYRFDSIVKTVSEDNSLSEAGIVLQLPATHQISKRKLQDLLRHFRTERSVKECYILTDNSYIIEDWLNELETAKTSQKPKDSSCELVLEGLAAQVQSVVRRHREQRSRKEIRLQCLQLNSNPQFQKQMADACGKYKCQFVQKSAETGKSWVLLAGKTKQSVDAVLGRLVARCSLGFC